jgi:hypothetical protein
MKTTKPITKDLIKACLFKEISDASLETECPFSVKDIEYFFENVFPNLEDEDGFFKHYDASMNMSDKDFETCFWDHHNAFEQTGTYEVMSTMSCINHDTKLFHLNDLADCKKLGENFPEREAMQAMLLSNIEPNQKIEIFKALSESYSISVHSHYDTIKENVVSHDYEYRYGEFITPETFLDSYDGVIAKAILRRNMQTKAQAKSAAKTKAIKI